MTISDEINIIANNIANQGKKPTVALVKTKLSQPTPLPIIISTLKNWHHDPSFISPPVEEKRNNKTLKDENSVENDIREMIESAIKPLKAEIAHLRSLILELKNRDN